ncbi:condensation domain-containing protein [Vibrio litoralis]|uniref:condensation domain-containing protein n=1 Tax=Vibrio litoralis TaxID=335972 RepID=UPI001867F4AF|nr:condensation domain-containing protein [Vibrio litoralis]
MGIALKLLQSMQAEGIFLHLTDDGNLGYEAQRSLTSEEIDRLKDNKSQLVTLLKASVSNDDTSLKPTPQCSISQENMYLLCQQSSINASYNLCFSLCFEQQPDIERLKNALAFIQTQQPALRSGFERQDGDVVMVRRAVDEVPFESIQLLEKDYDSWLNKVSQTPFDLSSPPLWKFVFVETEHTRRLVIVVHHIVWDGWSSALFREKLSQAYGQNLSAAEAQEHSGSDRFAQHQRDASEQGEWQQSREYWKTLLASAPMQNEWLTRKAPKSSLAGHVEHHIGIEQINHVQPHQRFNALLSAWFLALGRQYRCNRMVLGVAVANRDCHSELESSLGYFNNVVPVIQNHLLTTPAKQLMESVKGQWLGSIAHQGVPFGHIVNSAQRERNSHENPLTQVVIGYQSFDWDEDYAQLPHTLEAAKNVSLRQHSST